MLQGIKAFSMILFYCFPVQLTLLSLAFLAFVLSAAGSFPFLMGCSRFWG